MKIEQYFNLPVPCDVSWNYFQDLRQVAECIPGGEITGDDGEATYFGTVSLRIGSFNVKFDVEAQLENDFENKVGKLKCKGVDKRGGSRTRMTMEYRLSSIEDTTRVDIEVDLTLSGAIAQFGRTGLINETANIIMGQFSGCLEKKVLAVLAGQSTSEIEKPKQIGGISLITRGLFAWLKKLITRSQK